MAVVIVTDMPLIRKRTEVRLPDEETANVKQKARLSPGFRFLWLARL